MKKTRLKFLKFFTFVLLCSAVFTFMGYAYLENATSPAEKKNENVPYYKAVPDTAGIMLRILDSSVFLQFDFEKETVNAAFLEDGQKYENEIFGYRIDYIIKGDYSLLAEIIDRVGGIDLVLEDKQLNYTGVQIAELLSKTADRSTLKVEITLETLEKIADCGFSREDFLYIIENSTTNLTLPDCYYWSDFIKNTCSFVRVVG